MASMFSSSSAVLPAVGSCGLRNDEEKGLREYEVEKYIWNHVVESLQRLIKELGFYHVTFVPRHDLFFSSIIVLTIECVLSFLLLG